VSVTAPQVGPGVARTGQTVQQGVQQPPQPSQHSALAALIVVIAAGGIPTLAALAPIAALFGVTAESLQAAFQAMGAIPPIARDASVPERVALGVNLTRRAQLIVALAKRAMAGASAEQLQRQAQQSIDAHRRRAEAAKTVGAAARQFGLVLGWQSVLDSRTTEGCRQMHGNNFRVDQPPIVEGAPAYPGWVHGGTCRCLPVAPWPNGKLVAAAR